MPLSADELDSPGEYPLRLLQFLWDQANVAFTFSELAEQFRDTDFTLDDLDFSLRILVQTGRIEASYKNQKVYYIYRER